MNMKQFRIGEQVRVIKGVFTGEQGKLCRGIGENLYHVKNTAGDRMLVTLEQIESIGGNHGATR